MAHVFKRILYSTLCLLLISPFLTAQENNSRSLTYFDFITAIASITDTAAPDALAESLNILETLTPEQDDSLYFDTYLGTIRLYEQAGQYSDAIVQANKCIVAAQGTEYELDGYWHLARLYINNGDSDSADYALEQMARLCVSPHDYACYLLQKERRLYFAKNTDIEAFRKICQEIILHQSIPSDTKIYVLDHWSNLADDEECKKIDLYLDEIISNETDYTSLIEAFWLKYLLSIQTQILPEEKYLHSLIKYFHLYEEGKSNHYSPTRNNNYRRYIEALYELAAFHFESNLSLSYSYFKKVADLFLGESANSYIRNLYEFKFEFLSQYFKFEFHYFMEDFKRNGSITLDHIHDFETYIKKYREHCIQFNGYVSDRIGHLAKNEQYEFIYDYYDLIDNLLTIEGMLKDEQQTHLPVIKNREPAFNLCVAYKGIIMDTYKQLHGNRKSDTDTSRINLHEFKEFRNQLAKSPHKSACLFYVKYTDIDDYYGVFVFDANTDIPKFIELGSSEELFSHFEDISDFYSSSRLYDNIIQPAIDVIGSCEELYIIPDGVLSSINFAALQDKEGDYLYSKFDIRRLSDIRQILISSDTKPIKDALLYGGLDYYSKTYQSKNSKQNQDEDYYRQVYIPDTLDRATINYLPHSKSEVESIKKLLRNKQISATVLSGKKGTELSFKTISKNSPSIIHIATHGFYHKSKEGIDYDDYESGMLRSGLVMSSGGSAFIGETKDLYDDGLLLADEIAHLNLEKTDLVVLSACETALGDPTTEGLIGLLRGFKLAGAQTLVMSLWPVNDFVTNELMTDFYTYLCDGKSKREAFYKAVDNCRIKYQHPRLWAPFVMID